METAKIKPIFAELTDYREHTGNIDKTTNWPAREGYTREESKLSTSGDHHICSSVTHMVTAVNLLAAMPISEAWKMRSLIKIFTATKTLQGKPLTRRQRVQVGKFLPMALEPTAHARAGQKASQLCMDSGTRRRRSGKKKNKIFFIIPDCNLLFFLLREREINKEGKKENIPRSSLLLRELFSFENWNVFMLCRSTFLPTDPSSPKDRIFWQTVPAWRMVLLPDGLLLTQNPPCSHWFWTFLTLFQYCSLLPHCLSIPKRCWGKWVNQLS